MCLELWQTPRVLAGAETQAGPSSSLPPPSPLHTWWVKFRGAVPTPCVLLCLVSFLFIPFTGSPLGAQTDQNPSNLGWLTVGLGVGHGRGETPVALGAEASFQHGPHLFSGRALFFGEMEKTFSGAKEAAVLYGRTHHGRRHQAAFSVGLAIVGCQWRSICGDQDGPDDPFDDESDFDPTTGLALSGQTFWMPLRFFGIGLYGFANINTRGVFGGGMLGLRFGKLR